MCMLFCLAFNLKPFLTILHFSDCFHGCTIGMVAVASVYGALVHAQHRAGHSTLLVGSPLTSGQAWKLDATSNIQSRIQTSL